MNKDLSIIQRREFISSLVGVAGSAMLISSPVFSAASDFLEPETDITVGEIMNLYIKQLPGGPIANTVDTLKSGNAEMVVAGIVTCMFATIEVINKAVALGANFIIAHEPTFYNHQDSTKWLEHDDVYKYKAELLKKHKIAVWRNHDYIHSIQPDGVRTALVEKLGWQKFSTAENSIYKLANSITVKNLINQLKTKLDIPALRYIGNLDQPCSKILLMPGAAGGQRQIEALSKYKPDVLVTGEISEWETAEYVRDAKESGKPLALIVLGHIASEELGSTYMASWLVKNFPKIKTTFVKTGSSLSVM